MQTTGSQGTDSPQQDPAEAVEQEVTHKLIIVEDILREEITKQEKSKQHADDLDKHGDYRYREGFIDGLDYAIDIIHDRLMDLWNM